MQYEGTTKVQNSRKDMLASRFENLKMEEDETISEFSSKLSALAQEAAVLGKKYKDKKLVKKFLRCLPSRFMGYKSALSVSSNTENMPFSELVGMLKAHEMEVDSLKKPKSLALKCENRTTEDEEDDPISLLVRRFDRALRKTGKPQKKVASFKKTTEGDKSNRKSEVRCHECKGYGHFKNDCPTIKRRKIQCYGCKGFGHTQLECVNDQNRRKDKSMLAEEESDDDSEDDSVEETNNFVTFIGIAEIEEGQESESEPEEEKEDDLISSYKEVRHVLVSLNQENSELKKENQRLSVLVDKLSKDLEAANALGQGSVNLIKEKLELANQAESLRQHLKVEKQISEKLESELDQLNKQIQMFAGTKQLDKILSYECQANTKHGLGYSGWEQRSSDEIKFFSSGYNQPEGRRPVTKLRKGRECYYCGKIGHIKAYCYSRWNMVQKLIKQQKFSWNGSTNQVWVRKEDLRFEPKGQQKKNPFKPREFTVKRSSREDPMSMLWHGFKCNMAQVESDEDESEPWYFDSGCSRHMTGNRSYLRNFKKIKGGRVTFGDGSVGAIQGKGITKDEDQPDLVNVYLVQGLKANLISISQLCDEGLIVIFTNKGCRAVNDDGQIILAGERSGNNCYMWNKSGSVMSCFTVCDNLQLWHQRLGHMNIRNLNDLISKESIRGVPKIKGGDKFVCGACNQGKQVKVQHKRVPDVQSKAPLDLVHMDLMGPVQTESLGGKKYVFVLVDDFTRFTWVRFLREKSDTADSFRIWALQLMNERGSIKRVRSDHGGEFQNKFMKLFCESHEIAHQFAAPRTPQQNGVVERKNRTLQEMAHAMIYGNQVPKRFWAEAVSTACYIINRVYMRKGTSKTPYELWKGKTPNVSYFHVFGCRCYILNDKDHLGKFDSRSDEGIFLGYSGHSSAFRVFNMRTKVLVESVNVVFDDYAQMKWEKPLIGSDSEGDEADRIMTQENTKQVHRNHSASDIIGEVNEGRKTRGIQLDFKKMVGKFSEMVLYSCFVSVIEPKDHRQALQ
ncbi:uncharacterized protein LOC112086523 [Eutrema salsugineum]|uniref:uncharacterized protein LOC112086523 n=1 Tax=Eutrema salsugineum TaxID=72664 RepID=UPI000CECEE9C|nr:uncharacterized protein LOC112086523 [Eutrema salsugineum]